MDLCAWPKETVQTCHAVLIRRAWRRKWCIAPVPSVTHSPCPPALSFQHTLKQPCRLGFILFSKGKPGSFVIGLCEKPSLVYSFYKIQFGWRIRKYGALFLTFFNEKKNLKWVTLMGMILKPSVLLWCLPVFLCFLRWKDRHFYVKMYRQEAVSRLHKELEQCL